MYLELLDSFTSFLTATKTKPIHPVWLPIPAFYLLHAIRVSYGLHYTQYLFEGHKTGKRMSMAQSTIVPPLLVLAGPIISGIFMGEPSAWLADPDPIYLYGGIGAIYYYVNGFLLRSSSTSDKKKKPPKQTFILFSLLFAFLDGHARTGGSVAFGPLALAKLPQSDVLCTLTTSPTSLSAQLAAYNNVTVKAEYMHLVPSFASTFLGSFTVLFGGYILAPGLNLFMSQWSFNTPYIFTSDLITLGGSGMEIWAAVLSTMGYPVILFILSAYGGTLSKHHLDLTYSEHAVALLGLFHSAAIFISSTILPRLLAARSNPTPIKPNTPSQKDRKNR